MAAPVVAHPAGTSQMLSRPQVGIGRLPTRRPSSESRQSMNCKSCRKRKIKCNRLKPSCEACQVFSCTCIYDAVPKKRGPKTDALDALVKRVNGLEQRLQDDPKPESPSEAMDDEPALAITYQAPNGPDNFPQPSPPTKSPLVEPVRVPAAMVPPRPPLPLYLKRESIAFTDALLDTYFAQIHNKPYYILDEANTRQRLREGHLPSFMVNAIHAVSIRYVPQLCGGYSGAIRTSEDYASRAREGIEVDNPSIDSLQALLLLAIASFQAGKGKRSYMLLSHAISMALALDLHREVAKHMRVASVEREGRRRLFWTCYLMDRFVTSGCKRPSLISDEAVSLKYPAWTPPGVQRFVEGNYFTDSGSLPQTAGSVYDIRGSAAILVEIVRLLGITNRYLNAGGVKGDSHFPWHPQSTLSKIRSSLERWVSSTQDAFAAVEGLFGQPDGVSLALSKLVYHLIHCLLYRPFLPVDLSELSVTSQNQSWQVDATHVSFVHANAIVDLVDIGKTAGIVYWPSFVGYCISTAGTIHIHGAHYASSQEGDAFTNSAHYLAREMAQLSDLTFIWTGVNYQRETMQTVYASHSRLVHSLACSPIRFSPVFQMEDFFDRYPDSQIDGAHVTFQEVTINVPPERSGNGDQALQSWRLQTAQEHSAPASLVVNTHCSVHDTILPLHRDYKRRRTTDSSPYQYPTPTLETQIDPFEQQAQMAHYLGASQPPRPPLHQHHSAPIGQGLHHSERGNEETFISTFPENVFSPSFAISPATQNVITHQPEDGNIEAFAETEHVETPHAASTSVKSSATAEVEHDPFLSFLEQLAANDGAGQQDESDIFTRGQDSHLSGLPP